MKDNFYKSVIILLFGGAITKALGMLIKIIMNRIAGLDAMSLYMLVFPTFSLFMTISQLGFPTALSKLIAEEKHNNRNLIFSIIPISLLLNIFLILIILITAPIITCFLNDDRAYFPILTIILVLPFDCISSILRGYFFGKQKMIPHVISLITEQIVRLSLILLLIPKILDQGVIITVSTLIGINMVSELSSTIIMILFIKDKKIKKKDLNINKKEIKNILNIAIPTTVSRLIGSISYFFEPIIITTTLLNQNYNINYIVEEYGLIEGFILPLLLIPSFLTNALTGAIIPDISKKYARKDILGIKRRIKQILKIILLISLISSIILYMHSKELLMIIYKINKGENYIKILIPFFILLYIQQIFENVLQAINKSKKVMKNNIIGTIIKLLSIIIFSYLKIGLYNLIIGIILNITITTLLHIKETKKELIV